MWDFLFNSIWGWLGIGGVIIAGALAVAWFFPPFRKLALTVAVAAAGILAIYAKGARDASQRAKEQRARDEQRAIDNAKDARAGAERDIASSPPSVRDKYNRDN